MKMIVISGNIGKSAEVRSTQNGDKVTGWSVAVEERSGKEKRTVWFDCTMWGARGEALAQWLTKGSKVSVAGELSTREHNGKTYLTIRADQVTLMGGKPADDRDDGYSPQARTADKAQRPETSRADLDDEIPF